MGRPSSFTSLTHSLHTWQLGSHTLLFQHAFLNLDFTYFYSSFVPPYTSSKSENMLTYAIGITFLHLSADHGRQASLLCQCLSEAHGMQLHTGTCCVGEGRGGEGQGGMRVCGTGAMAGGKVGGGRAGRLKGGRREVRGGLRGGGGRCNRGRGQQGRDAGQA